MSRLGLVVVGVAMLSSCASRHSAHPSTIPPMAAGGNTTTTLVTQTSFPSSVDVQNGYGGRENFCAEAPLSGRVLYDGTTGVVHLTLAVGGLSPGEGVSMDWINAVPAGPGMVAGRGYNIAYFMANRTARSEQSTLRFFRPAEVIGSGLLLTTADTAAAPIGRLRPCP